MKSIKIYLLLQIRFGVNTTRMLYLERLIQSLCSVQLLFLLVERIPRVKKHQFKVDTIEPSIKMNVKEPTMTHP